MKWRFFFIRSSWTVLALGILLRLSYWQIVKADDLATQANRQRTTKREVIAWRGEILAQDGSPLVANKTGYFVTINPQVAPLAELAKFFPNLKYQQPTGQWFPVAHAISEEIKQVLEEKKWPGVDFTLETYRWYPDSSMSAHLAGFVGQEENGLPQGYFGLEGFYERELAGRSGRLAQELDALSHPILLGSGSQILPQNGRALTTSINRALQYLVYHKLQDGLQKYQAISGTVTVMEPASGRVVAMVSLPNYDPVSYAKTDPSLFKNPVVSEAYEPGSTFKTIVMSAALDAGVITPETECDICSGPVKVTDYVIKTWNDKYYPQSTITDVLIHSDNVGMVFVSRKLGTKKLLDYLKKFGFGDLTGVDLQEEIPATLRPTKDWYEIDYATAAFGQGIAVTPIQMLQAVSTLANRGVLLPPRIVDKIGDKIIGLPKGKQVISPLAAGAITQMMIKSVDAGEAKWAKPKGLVIAGKTGTAQIPVAGHYDKDKTIASFVGFAPADRPKFAMLVTLREPKTSPWGSETAAPLWFDIAREIFRMSF